MGQFLTRLFASPKAANDASEVVEHVSEVIEHVSEVVADAAVIATCIATQNMTAGIAAVQEIIKDGQELVEDTQELVKDGKDLVNDINELVKDGQEGTLPIVEPAKS
jgi:methyl-accepting chemotaxis protein